MHDIIDIVCRPVQEEHVMAQRMVRNLGPEFVHRLKLPVLWMTVVLSGCAMLGARLEGVSGPIAWQATDLRVVERQVTETNQELYAFTLVLKETQGHGITFTSLEHTMSQPGVVPIGDTQRETIAWRLHPYGELRYPFYSYIYCAETPCQNWGPQAPWWHIVLTGTDTRHQSVRVAIDLRLPQNPAGPAVRRSKELPFTPVGERQPVPVQIANHVPLVGAVLNHKEYVTLLLDTGATRTMLTPETARRLRLQPAADAPKHTAVVIGGQTVEFVIAQLSAIAVGDSVVENVPVGIALVVPEAPLVDGVLGGDFLQHFSVGLDYTASRLQLAPRPEARAPQPAGSAGGAGRRAVPLQIVNNRVLVHARLNHTQQVTLLLDTGAAHTLLHPNTAARLGMQAPAEAPKNSITVFGGRQIAFPVTQLSAVAVGDVLVEDLQVGVFLALPDMTAVHGILGGDFLQHFVVTLDYASNQLWLAANPALRQ
jgi:predicted aspartyl protease